VSYKICDGKLYEISSNRLTEKFQLLFV